MKAHGSGATDILMEPPGKETQQASDLYRLLVDRLRDYAIFALDPHGYILSWNAGAERLKGYLASEIIGRHFSVFYSVEDLASGKPARELQVATATGTAEDEGWRLRKDGSRFWASVLITALRDDDGKLVGFAKVTRDLTERRAAQERNLRAAKEIAAQHAARAAAEARTQEVRALMEQLKSQAILLESQSAASEVANRAKSQFLAAMSHELRTPLNAIGGYTQLLQMGIGGPVTPDQQLHLERIQRSQQHLLGVINDILNFSRIEAGQVDYRIERVPVCDLVETVVTMIAPQVSEKQIRLGVTRHEPLLTAMADPQKVEQIVLNLLSNAVKFTPAGGEILLSCDVEGDHLALNVRDSGIGIPPEQLENIFAPFMQVGRSLAAPKEGTGLGLAISRDLARGMNGGLTVYSREGEGSTFTLRLPRAG
jgi:PAS domain S-box-containing protein